MPNGVEERLGRVAKATADRHRMRVELSADDELRSFIARGVTQMRREGVDENEQYIRKAEENLSKFIAEMHRNSVSRGRVSIDAEAFRFALGLCPLWPFC